MNKTPDTKAVTIKAPPDVRGQLEGVRKLFVHDGGVRQGGARAGAARAGEGGRIGLMTRPLPAPYWPAALRLDQRGCIWRLVGRDLQFPPRPP